AWMRCASSSSSPSATKRRLSSSETASVSCVLRHASISQRRILRHSSPSSSFLTGLESLRQRRRHIMYSTLCEKNMTGVAVFIGTFGAVVRKSAIHRSYSPLSSAALTFSRSAVLRYLCRSTGRGENQEHTTAQGN